MPLGREKIESLFRNRAPQPNRRKPVGKRCFQWEKDSVGLPLKIILSIQLKDELGSEALISDRAFVMRGIKKVEANVPRNFACFSGHYWRETGGKNLVGKEGVELKDRPVNRMLVNEYYVYDKKARKGHPKLSSRHFELHPEWTARAYGMSSSLVEMVQPIIERIHSHPATEVSLDELREIGECFFRHQRAWGTESRRALSPAKALPKKRLF